MEGMQFRGVSWVTDAGKVTGRALVAGTLLGVAAIGMPMADAKPPTRDTVQVTVRFEPGSRAARLLERVGGRLSVDFDGQTVIATIPSSAVERLLEVEGVIEVSYDVVPNLVPVAEPVALDRRGNRGDEPGGFVDADHGHGEGGMSFSSLDMSNVNEIIGADRAQRRTRGAGVDVALIDTGVAPVDGVGRVLNGPDLSFDASNPEMTVPRRVRPRHAPRRHHQRRHRRRPRRRPRVPHRQRAGRCRRRRRRRLAGHRRHRLDGPAPP